MCVPDLSVLKSAVLGDKQYNLGAIVAQKNYILEAPLGVPPAPATADILNSWQTRVDDYSIVQCAMLYFVITLLVWVLLLLND